jgi:renalase
MRAMSHPRGRRERPATFATVGAVATNPVVVVGAGVSGLLAARRLAQAGVPVLVVEEGYQAGGRLATTVIATARLDHGAQFFTSRSPEFAALTQDWLAAGVAYEWCRGFDQPPRLPDGHPRYAATGGMAALARTMTAGLDVRLGTRITAVEGGTGRVLVDGQAAIVAGGIVLTPPVPRSLALMDAGRTSVDPAVRDALQAVTYEPTLAALVVLDGPSAVPPPGGVQLTDGPFSFVADNRAKGISDLPAVTLHATGEVSSARWDEPDPAVLATLLEEGGPWLGREPAHAELHRWRYARPTVLHPEPCLAVEGRVPLVLAGDAFGEPRVEGAARSGWAAAAALLERLERLERLY